MTITKVVKKYGNSGGVYLPVDWIGGKVKIELVEQPIDPKKDLLENLPLEHIVSVILYGSYARDEITDGSDMDVIIVTDGTAIKIPQQIRERYDIQVKDVANLKNLVEHDPIVYKVVKDESFALFNHKFLEELKQINPTASRSTKFRLDMAESSMNIVKGFMAEGADPIDLVYPLILRLKEALFIECFLTNKQYTTALLKKEITNHGISAQNFVTLINIYRTVRDNKRQKQNISIDVVEKLVSLLEAKLSYVKQKTLTKRH